MSPENMDMPSSSSTLSRKNLFSTKYGAHERHTVGRAGTPVDFTWEMITKSNKEDLLSNKDNNHRFIRMLSQSLEHLGRVTRDAKGDADVRIVETTIQSAICCENVLVGDDTGLLVLLCFHIKYDSCKVFFKPEIRSGMKKGP